MELFVTTTYLNAYKTDYFLIHDLAGKVIHYQRVKYLDYRNGMSIKFDAGEIVGEEWFLTAINIYKRDGQEYFYNFSYSGLNNGYVLDYQDIKVGLGSHKSAPVKVQITDLEVIGYINKIYGDGQGINWIYDRKMSYENLIGLDVPLFLVAQSAQDSALYYYYDEKHQERTKVTQMTVSANDFKHFTEMQVLHFADTIDDVQIGLYTELGAKPLIFSTMLNNNAIVIPFPKNIEIKQCDLILRDFQIKEAYRNIAYYTSNTFFEEDIVIPIPAYEVNYDEYNGVTINCDGTYSFFEVYSSFIGEETDVISTWGFIGPLHRKMNFRIPDIPASILNKHKLNIGKATAISIGLLTADIDHSLQDLAVPMMLSDAEWRIKNNSVEVIQFIKFSG